MATEETTPREWKVAFKHRTVEKDLIFHSESGVQYAIKMFVNVLYFPQKNHSSMSHKGNCGETAVAERLFKSLKTELIYGNKLISKELIKMEIFEYIEIGYKQKRRHSPLNYVTIAEFNNQNNYKNAAQPKGLYPKKFVRKNLKLSFYADNTTFFFL